MRENRHKQEQKNCVSFVGGIETGSGFGIVCKLLRQRRLCWRENISLVATDRTLGAVSYIVHGQYQPPNTDSLSTLSRFSEFVPGVIEEM